jgi:hypothetical protein
MSDTVVFNDLAQNLARRGIPLSQESALFAVLEAIDALGTRALVLSASTVQLTPEGTVSLTGNSDFAHDETSVLEGAIETLEEVLQPIPVHITELAVKVRSGTFVDRTAFTAELHAMLVPLNRKAARRMLGRLVRDCLRPAGALASSSLRSTAPVDESVEIHTLLREPASANSATGDVLDTLIEHPALEGRALETTLGGRLPADWDDNTRYANQKRSERRNAMIAMFLAAVALVAAVMFLVGRMKAAGALKR